MDVKRPGDLFWVLMIETIIERKFNISTSLNRVMANS